MNIKQLRLIKGLNQSEFANQLGIAQNTLSNYENGNRKPEPDLIKKIASTFSVTTDYLLNTDLLFEPDLPVALQKKRTDLGLSLQDISLLTNIPLSLLENFENGLQPINLYLFKLICKNLKISPIDFYKEFNLPLEQLLSLPAKAFVKYDNISNNSLPNNIQTPYSNQNALSQDYLDAITSELIELLQHSPEYLALFEEMRKLNKTDIEFITRVIVLYKQTKI